MTGVQRYALEITQRLIANHSDGLRVIAPPDVLPENSSLIPFETVGRLTGHAWEQISLPRYVWKSQARCVLNMANVAPILSRIDNVVVIHDVGFLDVPDSYSFKYRMAHRFIVRSLVPRSRVVTVSQFSRSRLEKHYPKTVGRVEIVSPAVGPKFHGMTGESDREQLKETSVAPYLVTISSQAKHKNLAALIAAQRKVWASTRTELWIAGGRASHFKDGGSRETDAGVRWLGRLPDDQLIKIMKRSSGLVFPSYYEGFGLPPLEAQAAGIPVIAGDIPALRETLGAAARFFPPKNVDELAAKMIEVIAANGQSDEDRTSALENVYRFDWDESARSMAKIVGLTS